jgi:hypothetical protein
VIKLAPAKKITTIVKLKVGDCPKKLSINKASWPPLTFKAQASENAN